MKLVPEIPGGEVTPEQIEEANRALWEAYCADGGPKCVKKPQNPSGSGQADEAGHSSEAPPSQQQNTAPSGVEGKPVGPSCQKMKDDPGTLKCLPPVKIIQD